MNLILKLCEYLMLYNIFNLIRIMGKLFFGSEGITPSSFDGKLNMKDCFRVNMEEWVTTLSKPLPFFLRKLLKKSINFVLIYFVYNTSCLQAIPFNLFHLRYRNYLKPLNASIFTFPP